MAEFATSSATEWFACCIGIAPIAGIVWLITWLVSRSKRKRVVEHHVYHHDAPPPPEA